MDTDVMLRHLEDRIETLEQYIRELSIIVFNHFDDLEDDEKFKLENIVSSL